VFFGPVQSTDSFVSNSTVLCRSPVMTTLPKKRNGLSGKFLYIAGQTTGSFVPGWRRSVQDCVHSEASTFEMTIRMETGSAHGVQADRLDVAYDDV
jgi:hypothetical protein